MGKKILKDYVSPIDIALEQFNNSHNLTAAQQRECDKYDRIISKRDDPTSQDDTAEDLWSF